MRIGDYSLIGTMFSSTISKIGTTANVSAQNTATATPAERTGDVIQISISNTRIYEARTAEKNIQDGIALTQIMDQALASLQENGEKLRELAVSYNSDAINSDQKKMIEDRAKLYLAEMEHIIKNTTYNDIRIFEQDKFSIQTGVISSDTVEIKVPRLQIPHVDTSDIPNIGTGTGSKQAPNPTSADQGSQPNESGNTTAPPQQLPANDGQTGKTDNKGNHTGQTENKGKHLGQIKNKGKHTGQLQDKKSEKAKGGKNQRQEQQSTAASTVQAGNMLGQATINAGTAADFSSLLYYPSMQSVIQQYNLFSSQLSQTTPATQEVSVAGLDSTGFDGSGSTAEAPSVPSIDISKILDTQFIDQNILAPIASARNYVQTMQDILTKRLESLREKQAIEAERSYNLTELKSAEEILADIKQQMRTVDNLQLLYRFSDHYRTHILNLLYGGQQQQQNNPIMLFYV